MCCCAGFTVQPTQGGKRGSSQQEPSLEHTHTHTHTLPYCKKGNKTVLRGTAAVCAAHSRSLMRRPGCEHTHKRTQHTQTETDMGSPGHTLRCLEATTEHEGVPLHLPRAQWGQELLGAQSSEQRTTQANASSTHTARHTHTHTARQPSRKIGAIGSNQHRTQAAGGAAQAHNKA